MSPPIQQFSPLRLRLLTKTHPNYNSPPPSLAIDCEMVGLGPLGSESALARLSIVNFHGHLILDTFVLPRERVTDWRTWVSGVSEKDMVGARRFEDVQREVAGLVEGKVLVGHAIGNDTKVSGGVEGLGSLGNAIIAAVDMPSSWSHYQALLLSHPSPLIRDTQRFKLIRQALKSKMPGLKKATETLLGVKIQSGVHSSVCTWMLNPLTFPRVSNTRTPWCGLVD